MEEANKVNKHAVAGYILSKSCPDHTYTVKRNGKINSNHLLHTTTRKQRPFHRGGISKDAVQIFNQQKSLCLWCSENCYPEWHLWILSVAPRPSRISSSNHWWMQHDRQSDQIILNSSPGHSEVLFSTNTACTRGIRLQSHNKKANSYLRSHCYQEKDGSIVPSDGSPHNYASWRFHVEHGDQVPLLLSHNNLELQDNWGEHGSEEGVLTIEFPDAAMCVSTDLIYFLSKWCPLMCSVSMSVLAKFRLL